LQSTTKTAKKIFNLLENLFEGNFFQLAVDRTLHDATKKCPHRPEYEPDFSGSVYQDFDVEKVNNSGSFFLAIFIFCFALFSIVMIAAIITKIIVLRRHKKWISSLAPTQIELLQRQQSKEEERKTELNITSQSLFRSGVVPLWVRLSMPLVILGNIGFFLSGHLSLGASVSIVGSIAGQSFEENGFFEFSMARSTIEIWNGKRMKINMFWAHDCRSFSYANVFSWRRGTCNLNLPPFLCLAIHKTTSDTGVVVCFTQPCVR
jgi:hypothetical protein